MGAPKLDILDSANAAAAALDPQRARLLTLLQRPDSAAGVARRLGLPRQKVNYHLRELEKLGLVEFVEERKRGNCVERVVLASATSYVIDPGLLGDLGADPARTPDRLSLAHLVGVAARIIRDLAVIRRGAGQAGQKVATLSLEAQVRFASAAERSAFAEELAGDLARLTSKYHDESAAGGRLFHVIACSYPAITKTEQEHQREMRSEETTP